MEKPKLIYKYESFSARSLQNLKSQILYFGSPRGFNDPYDCALKVTIEEPSIEDIESLRTDYCKRRDIPLHIRNEFKKSSNEVLKELVSRNAESVLEKHVQSFLDNKGITCFSERNDDLLMWSHYGGSYKGFCLEFSTELEPFTHLRKVKYSELMPRINAIEALMSDDFDQLIDLFLTKSKSWAYEKEWRCIHHVVGTNYKYETKALKGVYFGPDIEEDSLEIICLILKGQNPNVNFWQGRRSEDKFEVEFSQFNYMSHVEAKEKGFR